VGSSDLENKPEEKNKTQRRYTTILLSSGNRGDTDGSVGRTETGQGENQYVSSML